MISISMSAENSPRRVAGDVNLYREYLSRLTMSCMRHEAALCAIGFLRFTPPFLVRKTGEKNDRSGLGKDDEKVGNIAVERDIRSMFKPTDSMLKGAVDPFYGSLESFMKWKNQRIPKGSNSIIAAIWQDANVERAYSKARNLFKTSDRARIMDSPGQMRTVHDTQLRLYRGRITRHNGPAQDIKKNPYLADASVINRFIQMRQARVGWLKSAWEHVISSIGKVNLNGRMVTPGGGSYRSRWITRHGAGGGGHHSQDFGRKSVRIVNNIGDNDYISTTASVIAAVLQWRNNNLNSRNIHQDEVDKSIRLWNAGRIRIREQRIYGN